LSDIDALFIKTNNVNLGFYIYRKDPQLYLKHHSRKTKLIQGNNGDAELD
jgi:hypothetical protein